MEGSSQREWREGGREVGEGREEGLGWWWGGGSTPQVKAQFKGEGRGGRGGEGRHMGQM